MWRAIYLIRHLHFASTFSKNRNVHRHYYSANKTNFYQIKSNIYTVKKLSKAHTT